MLLGFHGRAQAGKDTAYARLATLMPAVERRAFADKLYASAAAALGTTPAVLNTLKTDPGARIRLVHEASDRGNSYSAHLTATDDVVLDMGVRRYLQNYGTEAHRELFGTDFWVNQLDTEHEGRIVCVTDVRFDNEAAAIRRAGGHVVKVIGPDDVEGVSDGHASEAGLADNMVDFRLFNTERGDGFRELDRRLAELLDYVRCVRV